MAIGTPYIDRATRKRKPIHLQLAGLSLGFLMKHESGVYSRDKKRLEIAVWWQEQSYFRAPQARGYMFATDGMMRSPCCGSDLPSFVARELIFDPSMTPSRPARPGSSSCAGDELEYFLASELGSWMLGFSNCAALSTL
jgi:hypothetical protein